MSNYRQQPYERRSKPPSPTGSVRSVATKASTKSRMSGVTGMLKDKYQATKSSFQRKIESAKQNRWAEEVESSQKTQDGIPHLVSSPNNPFLEIEEDTQSVISNSESLEEDIKCQRHSDDDDALPPSSPVHDTPETRGISTPPNLMSELPDLDKTPKTPRVAAISEAELYKLKAQEALASREADPFQTTAPITENQFKDQIDAGKTNVGDIVDEEIRSSTPDFDTEMWEIDEEQVKIVKDLFNELGRIFGRCSPHGATNPEVIAALGKNFMWNMLQSDWADVPIKGVTMRSMAKHLTMEREEEMKETKDVEMRDQTNKEMPKNKGKKVRIEEASRESNAPKIGSPIKVSGVPKPLPIPTQPVVSKRAGTKKTLAGVTPRIPESGHCQQAMGRDASGSNAPSTSAVAAAGRNRDASGSNAPSNPPLSGKGVPGKSGAPITDTRPKKNGSPPPPVPLHSKPKPRASAPSPPSRASFADAVRRGGNGNISQTSSALLTPETVHLAQQIMAFQPGLTFKEAMDLTTGGRPEQGANHQQRGKPQPKGRQAVMSERAKAAISSGLNRKSAQFAYSEVIRREEFEDMGKIINEMNKHLIYARSQIRVQTGRLLKNVVHFNLNRVPNQPEFDRIKEVLSKALQKDVPEGENAFAPQSIAHLILKGFNYFTNKFNRRPEDILTGEQVLQMMYDLDQWKDIEAVKKPSVVRSKGSNDMAVVFMDVWDSKSGIRTKNLVNKVYHMGGKLIKVEYAKQREFVPQCQKCWKWDHGTSRCRINHQRCARCGQGHMTINHDEFSTCCGAIRKEKQVKFVKCEHKLKCLNCKGEHTADSFKCVYKKNQNDRAWHDRRANSDREEELAKRERRNAVIKQTLAMPESEIEEIQDSQ
ncbi:hypothetical protein Agabi119p4_9979 [Agaricus bisporus var. burnettii]|uniref:Uncharacterized protein n=2 Tax=Agaricus bisporus var. burnettii TaxID=192524 RepID=A0A8H7C3U0_AGABI|nr:hypothetical protein Agabi119p4_9979 [Agaricus bisporus var. burnettii]